MQCEIVTVAEDHGTADALRAVASKITASTVVVLSGDLLIDLPVNALVASHLVREAGYGCHMVAATLTTVVCKLERLQTALYRSSLLTGASCRARGT
jgi:NDP-sugar pyrophosphorylase family protein